jgi:NTE family protein
MERHSTCDAWLFASKNLARSLHAMSLRLVAVFATAFVFSFGGAVNSAGEEPRTGRPKIGLVLSGGGARGVAHVGALEALERLKVPIDYVAGTSMGAVVGGLYASGMTPEEIEAWFRAADWHVLLSDAVPRSALPFERKERDFTMNQNLELALTKSGVQIPAGIVKGTALLALLRQLLLPVVDIEDFDELPVPFRAVATDIETGKPVVMSRGDLPLSIRASMTVPGVFTPVILEDQLLVDGGIAYNLPIQVVKEMGADIVIAVDVRADLLKRADLENAVSIANQMLSIFIERTTLEQIELLNDRDVYIRIPMPGVSSAGFEGSYKLVANGLEAAMEEENALARYSVSEEAYAEYLSEQRRERVPSVPIRYVTVKTEDDERTEKLDTAVEFSPGKREDLEGLQEAVLSSPSLRRYQITGFEVLKRGDEYEIELNAREIGARTTFISAGFNFGYSTMQQTDANLLLSYRMTELNRLGGEWDSLLSLGDSSRFITAFRQPIDHNRVFFVSPRGALALDFVNGRDNLGERIRFRLQTAEAGFDVGLRVWDAGELQIGYVRGMSRVGRTFGTVEETGNIDRGYLEARLILDELNSTGFPVSGYYAEFRARFSDHSLGGADNYTRLEGEYYAPITVGKNTFVPRLVAGVNPGGPGLPIYDRFSLGGFLNLSGLAVGDVYDQNAALAEVIYYREIGKLPPGLGGGLYAGLSLEAGGAWADIDDIGTDDLMWSGSVFLGAESLFGPFYLGLGIAEEGAVGIYLQLSPLFHQGRIQEGALRSAR